MPGPSRWTLLSAVPAALVAGGCGTPNSGPIAEGEAARSATEAPGSPTGPVTSQTSDRSLPTATFDAVWTTVRDTHFDPTHLDPASGGVDWDGVRLSLRPKADEAATPEALRSVLDEMLATLGQSHFLIVSPEDWPREGLVPESTKGVSSAPSRSSAAGNTPLDSGAAAEALPSGRGGLRVDGPLPPNPAAAGTLGMEVRVIDGRALVAAVLSDLPAHSAGVQTGWELVMVDDQAVQQAIAEASVGVVASRASQASQSSHASPPPRASWLGSVQAKAVQSLLDGLAGERRRVRLRDRVGAEVTLDLALAPTPGEEVVLGDLPPMRARVVARQASERELEQAGADGRLVGVIAFNVWLLPIVKPVHEAIDRFRGADGLVIDLRGNPGGIGYFATAVAGHLVDRRSSLGSLRTREGATSFEVLPRRHTAQGEIAEPYAGPVALLVDECTASTSEMFAGGLQALGRVRVFGSPTAGATLPARTTALPNGDVLLHATAEFALPDGRALEGRGVTPDEQVLLRREDLLAERDPTLLAALRWIAGQPSAGDCQ